MKKLIYSCGLVSCLLMGCQSASKVEPVSSSVQQPTAYIEFDQHYNMILADGSVKPVNEHIRMAKLPNKVIVLDMATLDSLYAVNIYQQIVGIRADETKLKQLPESLRREFSKSQYISVGNHDQINFNMINKLAPEVIFIGNNECNEATIQQLKQAAPQAKIIYTGIDNKNYLASLRQQSQLLGDIFNKASLYETYFKNIDLDVAYIRDFDKKDIKLAVIDIQGYDIRLTTEYNDLLKQLGLGDNIYSTDLKIETVSDVQTEEVANQKIMIARESATEDEQVVANRQQQIDKEKQIVLNFDKNIAMYQPTSVIIVDDAVEEHESNITTILSAQYMQDLSAIKNNHYRITEASEWHTVNGGIYSLYVQVEDVVKLLQKISK